MQYPNLNTRPAIAPPSSRASIALPAPTWRTNSSWGARFYWQHLWVPLGMFALASAVLLGLRMDHVLADWIYAWEGHAWSLRSGRITEDLLHIAGRKAAQIAWAGVLLMFLLSLAHGQFARWRRPLAYLLLSVLLATAVVGVMKRWTHMDCPWDLLRYGGEKTYYGLFERLPVGAVAGRCFPGGHASAGFAWVSLYFFLMATLPRWRWWGLGLGLGVGLVFGIAQQLRGAHFLSHDVWTLMVCWLTAVILHHWMLGTRCDMRLEAGAA